MYTSPRPRTRDARAVEGHWVLTITYVSNTSTTRYFPDHTSAANVRDFVRKLPRVASTSLNWEEI